MPLENGHPAFGNGDGAAPTVRNRYIPKLWMQSANSLFETRKTFGCGAGFDGQRLHFTPIGKMHQAATKNDLAAEQAPPKVREIHGVERLSIREPNGI